MGLAELKRVVDKHDPAHLHDASKAFSEIFEVFDRLITDESLFSQVMRRLSSLLKAGIFFHPYSESVIVSKAKAVRNKNLRAIFFGQFGKKTPATLFDSLCSVLDMYKADTEYLEKLVEQEKREVGGRLDPYQSSKR